MNAVGTRTPRRTLLQRGLALVGGALGLSAMGSEVAARSPAGEDPRTLHLIGRRRAPVRVAGGTDRHLVSSGDLFDTSGERTVGRFHTNRFCLETALGSPLPAESNIAFQTFALPEGSLFGLGAGPWAGGERACAVVGGTGRFAGARGTYVERAPASGRAGRDSVEFVFTLSA